MSLAETTYEIEYPESDGEPMGETDLHIHWMIRIRDILKHRYRSERVYVAADLLMYYVEGDPTKMVSPDVFVVKDCDAGFRRVFKIWEEQRVPNVAIEVTSKGTRREDEIFKPKRYAEIGIEEYFLYDPTADYLFPPLRGLRLNEDRYELIEPNDRGVLDCRSLGITFELDGGDLVLRDLASGSVLLTRSEAADAERDAAKAAQAQAEAERDALRDEVERLRKQVGGGESPKG